METKKLAFTIVTLSVFGLAVAVGIWATDWVVELQVMAAFLGPMLFLAALPFLFVFALAVVGLYLWVGRKP